MLLFARSNACPQVIRIHNILLHMRLVLQRQDFVGEGLGKRLVVFGEGDGPTTSGRPATLQQGHRQ